MFHKSIISVLVLSALGNGIPLEDPSQDMSKFFQSSNRIVGGSDAPEGYAPHMAALLVGDQYISLVCGGSIVACDKILTAAHCIDILVVWDELIPSFHAVVGSNRWRTPENSVQFKGFHIHPQWDWVTIKNDIGFLLLEQPLTWSKTVGLVALNMDRIEGDEPSYVTGWGLLGTWPLDFIPELLQLLYVKTINHERCVKDMEAATEDWFRTPFVDSATEICTFHSPGHGMCNGDSGSALVLKKTNTQIGIVSWGFPCALGAPDVFTRLSGFRDYIQDIMTNY